jgi:hypothetical protein
MRVKPSRTEAKVLKEELVSGFRDFGSPDDEKSRNFPMKDLK